jgi:hypothetical protein
MAPDRIRTTARGKRYDYRDGLHMLTFKDSRDIDLSIFIYLMVFATPVALGAYSIDCLLQPLVITGPADPRLVGNSPARASFVFQFVKDEESSITMARAAEQSADEANLALRADDVRKANGDEGVRRANINTAAKTRVKPTRKPQRIARGPAFPQGFGVRAEAHSFRWGYETQNRYAGRWF